MQFALLVKSHANARYAQSLQKLAVLECECLLYALNINAAVTVERLAGTPFMLVETAALTDEQWAYLSRHSAVAFAAVKDGEWLRPLPLARPAYLEDDLSQVLKYKGKTNADFTGMMLHCARSASAFALSREPLTVLDPVCGKGTTLFYALQEGENAIGVEADGKAVREADVYLQRYLQYHRYKHCREQRSLTLPRGGAVPERGFTLANDPQAYKNSDTRTLRLIEGDTACVDQAVGTNGCHLIVGDLPYGVQHAPKAGRTTAPLEKLLAGALPAYYRALKTGGAVALSFNTFTLSRRTLIEALKKAGFTPLVQPPFDDFSHWVEQAVNRDMVVAVK